MINSLILKPLVVQWHTTQQLISNYRNATTMVWVSSLGRTSIGHGIPFSLELLPQQGLSIHIAYILLSIVLAVIWCPTAMVQYPDCVNLSLFFCTWQKPEFSSKGKGQMSEFHRVSNACHGECWLCHPFAYKWLSYPNVLLSVNRRASQDFPVT